jgi:hypothetical protein
MDDLDMATMASLLGPPIESKGRGMTPWDNAARLIQEFGQADGFAPAPNPAGLWFGEAFAVHADGSDGSSFVVLRLREGGSGRIEGSWEMIRPEGFEESADAADLARALRTGAAPKAPNRVLDFLRSTPPRAAFVPLESTSGVSMVLQADRAVYLRTDGNRLITVERRTPVTASGDRVDIEGRYAEVWPIR